MSKQAKAGTHFVQTISSDQERGSLQLSSVHFQHRAKQQYSSNPKNLSSRSQLRVYEPTSSNCSSRFESTVVLKKAAGENQKLAIDFQALLPRASVGSRPGLYKYEVPESAVVYRNCKKRVVKNGHFVRQVFETTKSANARKAKESASQRASPLGLSRKASGKSTQPGWVPSMNCSNPSLRSAASTVATSQLVSKQYLKQLKEIPSRVCSDRGE